jgi:hypothetical protein
MDIVVDIHFCQAVRPMILNHPIFLLTANVSDGMRAP